MNRLRNEKSDAWWEENGEDFTEFYEAIQEIDERYSVRYHKRYWNHQTRRYERSTKIAKTSKGSLSNMASIVWRWNLQRTTKGYPNPRLWRDIMIMFARLDQFNERMITEDEEKNQRILEIAIAQREAQLAYEERIRRQEERVKLAEQTREEGYTEKQKKAFTDLCVYYDIPEFNSLMGQHHGERRHISQMKKKMCNDLEPSDVQRKRLFEILGRDQKWGGELIQRDVGGKTNDQ
jgi:hypothetical protein